MDLKELPKNFDFGHFWNLINTGDGPCEVKWILY